MDQRRNLLEQVAEGVLCAEAAFPQLENRSSAEQDLCLELLAGVHQKPRVKIRIPLALIQHTAWIAAPFVEQESRDMLRLFESAAMKEQGMFIQVENGETGETARSCLKTKISKSGN